MSRVLMKFAACGLFAAMACAGAAPAQAQYASVGGSGGKQFELTLFNGYYVGSDLYSSVGTGAGVGADIGLSNSYMWGGRLGWEANDRFGVEFVYSRIGSDLTVKRDVAGYDPAGDIGRLNGNCYDMDFLFYQPTPNARTKGYFTVGFGWTVTDPDIQPAAGTSIDSNSLFAWNFGAGTKIDMNEKLALRLEARWRVTDTAISTSSGVYCDYWGYCYSYSSDWYSSGELTAGLSYKMGSRR